jgi:hypothetical protein
MYKLTTGRPPVAGGKAQELEFSKQRENSSLPSSKCKAESTATISRGGAVRLTSAGTLNVVRLLSSSIGNKQDRFEVGH